MEQITEAQCGVLTFVVRYGRRHGRPPTLAEIQLDRKLASSRGVRKHLQALERKGFLELQSGIRRGITLLDSAYQALPMEASDRLPIVGRVEAGRPILASEHIDDFICVEPDTFRPRANLLMEVTGESMVDAGILPHDLVAIHLQTEAHSGQIVLARVVDEATGEHGITVKVLRKKGSFATLESANDDVSYTSITGRLGEDIFVEGIFSGLIRRGSVSGKHGL